MILNPTVPYTTDSFKSPEHSYTFPWIGGEAAKIYVVKFYYREQVKTKVFILEDPIGNKLTVKASEVKEIEDDLLDQGFEIKEKSTRP